MYKDPEKLIKFLITAMDKSARAIVRRIDYPYREPDLVERRSIPYRNITDYVVYLERIKYLLLALKLADYNPIWEKYYNLVTRLTEKLWEAYRTYGKYYAQDYARYEQEVIDPLGKQLFPDIWGKDPEELLGVKKEQVSGSISRGIGSFDLLREIRDIKDRLARIESLLERLLESCSRE